MKLSTGSTYQGRRFDLGTTVLEGGVTRWQCRGCERRLVAIGDADRPPTCRFCGQTLRFVERLQ